MQFVNFLRIFLQSALLCMMEASFFTGFVRFITMIKTCSCIGNRAGLLGEGKEVNLYSDSPRFLSQQPCRNPPRGYV